ncbi:MAG: YfgM family protein [Burkholderiales bacterium]
MYDLEEQEKVDALKAWWNDNGRRVWAAVLALALGYAGYQGWHYYQRNQAAKAGVLFEAVRVAAQQGDAAKTLQASKVLQEAQPDSALATRGALIAAAVNHAKGDNAATQSELSWIIGHTKEAALADLARLRQAGLLADDKKYEDALHLLEANHEPDFAALTADLRGDIQLALNRPDQAREAYKIAVEKSPADDVLHQIAQSKLEALGDPK